MEGFDNEEKSVYMQQGAAVRSFGEYAFKPRSFVTALLGRDFDCPKLYNASL
jgi:hypothetical protein